MDEGITNVCPSLQPGRTEIIIRRTTTIPNRSLFPFICTPPPIKVFLSVSDYELSKEIKQRD
jgi:hypothetical protein